MKNSKGTLLLVDDEVSILNALKRIFVTEGYDVKTATSGPEGLKILEHTPTDIIISDMRMPVMSGAEFFRITAERWENIKRILLTGYADINSAISAINEGKIDYYISKPWENEEFINIIQKSLDNKRLKEHNVELQALLKKQNEELKVLNNQLEEKVEERTAELFQSYKELQGIYAATSQVFLSMQEFNEEIYKGYCRNVADQAKQLAENLKLSERDVQMIYLAAMLHNLGKKGLPAQIMHKPFTQLTPKEHKIFVQYPILAATMLSAFPPLKEVANLILHHRERYDGKGYPSKLKGQAIPLGSRVLAVVVDYNELQYGLIDQQKYYSKFALSYLNHHLDRYDPKVLLAFNDLMENQPRKRTWGPEQELSPHHLEPGMILSRDLSQNDFVFLRKGFTLTPEVIDKMRLLDNFPVYVEKGIATHQLPHGYKDII